MTKTGTVGRPRKDTPEKRQIIIDAISKKMPMYLACDYAMISRDTLNRWINGDEDFAAQIRYAKAVAAGSLIDKVCEDGNGAWKVLKNLQSEHFKDEIETIQTNNYAIILNAPDGKTTEIKFAVQPNGSSSGHPQFNGRSQPTDHIDVGGDTVGEIDQRLLVATKKDSKSSS